MSGIDEGRLIYNKLIVCDGEEFDPSRYGSLLELTKVGVESKVVSSHSAVGRSVA